MTDLEKRLVSRFPGLEHALRGIDGRVTVIMTAAAILLLVFRKFGGSSTFLRLAPESLHGHHYLMVYGDLYWFAACFVILGVVPLLITRKDVGLGLGDWRFGLKWVAILYGAMLPVVVIAAMTTTFSRYYPINSTMQREALAWLTGGRTPDGFVATFLAYELLYGIYFLGWEFFFRGFLTHGLHERLGFNGILAANIPFVLMHIGKPFPEALGSVVGGIALGVFALRARSFWYCWLLHAMIAWTMDVCALAVLAARGGHG